MPAYLMYFHLKFLHVVLTIIAIGFTSSFGLILGRAKKAGDVREMRFALQVVQAMSAVSTGCFVLLVLVGAVLVQVAGLSYRAVWIHGSIGLFLVALALGSFVMKPTLARRIAILETRGLDDPEFVALGKRSAQLGGVLGLLGLAIVWMMVAKP
jgi:uncharacterized membrane protein